ncbi:MAG TPA: hypothetical protein GXX51_07630 [Firmicutes bacterium]|nr:hypothetical protein [Bacillota bacterium]
MRKGFQTRGVGLMREVEYIKHIKVERMIPAGRIGLRWLVLLVVWVGCMGAVAPGASIAGLGPAWGPGVAWAASQADSAKAAQPVEVTASGSMEYDAQKKITRASGNVIVKYKTFILSGDSVVFEEGPMKASIQGNARFQDTAPESGATMTAQNIVALLKDKRVTAMGRVNLKRGEMLLTADKVDGYLNEDRAVAEGNVRIVQEDLVATGDFVTYLDKEKKAVISGHARVESDGRVFTGGKITVLMDEKRVIGSEGTRLVIPVKEE